MESDSIPVLTYSNSNMADGKALSSDNEEPDEEQHYIKEIQSRLQLKKVQSFRSLKGLPSPISRKCEEAENTGKSDARVYEPPVSLLFDISKPLS